MLNDSRLTCDIIFVRFHVTALDGFAKRGDTVITSCRATHLTGTVVEAVIHGTTAIHQAQIVLVTGLATFTMKT